MNNLSRSVMPLVGRRFVAGESIHRLGNMAFEVRIIKLKVESSNASLVYLSNANKFNIINGYRNATLTGISLISIKSTNMQILQNTPNKLKY